MKDQFPRGKMTDDDEGQLQIVVGLREKTVIVNFGKQVAWLGFDKATAIAFANKILEEAERI